MAKEQVKLALNDINVKHNLDDLDTLPKLESKENIKKLDAVSSESDVSSDDFSDTS